MPNGGVIGKPNVPSQGGASGVWSLRRLYGARRTNTWPLAEFDVEYLVVAGGGGASLGGAGAGGYRAATGFNVAPATAYTVTVGAGGAAATSLFNNGVQGNSSVFSTITSTGGGSGGGASQTGGTGGSGGGNGNTSGGGSGTAGQGFAGGGGITDGVTYTNGGAGGGASQAGATALEFTPAKGGDGVASSITGSSVTRGGGGGGLREKAGTPGAAGGSGGGGAGALLTGPVPAVAGSVNTGGGGGGGRAGSGYPPAAGGSGIVLIRYPNTFQDLLIGTGLTYRNSSGTPTSGANTRVAPSYSPSGFKVYEFRAGTGSVTF